MCLRNPTKRSVVKLSWHVDYIVSMRRAKRRPGSFCRLGLAPLLGTLPTIFLTRIPLRDMRAVSAPEKNLRQTAASISNPYPMDCLARSLLFYTVGGL